MNKNRLTEKENSEAMSESLDMATKMSSYLDKLQSANLEFLTPLSIEAMAAKKAGLPVKKTGMGKSKAVSFAKAYSETVSKTTNLVIIGIAGACGSYLRPGDIVVANKIFKITETGHIDDSPENPLTIPESNVFFSLLQNLLSQEQSAPSKKNNLYNASLGCSEVIITGKARKNADSDQIAAVEMESFWLANTLIERVKTFQVVRIILDTPDNEIFSLSTPLNFRIAFRQIQHVAQLIRSLKEPQQPQGIIPIS